MWPDRGLTSMQLELAIYKAELLWRDQPTVGDAHPIERPIKTELVPEIASEALARELASTS